MANGRVLVVEDDGDIGGLICEMIRGDGFDCRWVRSDRDAYTDIEAPPPLRALVVDINLGAGTTGFDVARFARKAIPDVAVIYVTGEATPQSLTSFGVPDAGLVMKPFTADELLRPLRERLGRAQPEADAASPPTARPQSGP
jgi:DNA-binding response OmpR family regulator